ncbi:MAG: hypothetical protein FD147_824 [Chloroflexi bacterium]|nr:MAG: hypothetical protein FD147_824 [Chloroflexota bacterium]MBA4376600.1 Zn-dependent protease [Anaerolinea sp.]
MINKPAYYQFNRFPFAHTFSIVARDPLTGQMGVAVQSHWFSTGSLVTWAEPGVGAIATQSMVEVSYGPHGLDKLRNGKNAPDALKELLALDEGQEVRQVAMVDARGNIGIHTGNRCIAEAGHQTGAQFSVQANMMLKNTVWPAMAKAYENYQGDLADRLLVALDAAQAEGGDIRGKQSAAMLVVDGVTSDRPWTGILVDLRVEDHPEPLFELRRLLNVQRAYQSMNRGDVLLSEGKTPEAFDAYNNAALLAPHIDELPFWQAVTLADSGKVEESLPIFKRVFAADPNWALLLERLPKAGLFKDDPELIKKITSLKM